MTQTKRYHGLDALRAVAMVMGLVIHSVMPFADQDILADVAPGATAPGLTPFWQFLVVWIHQWRMPVFFLLSGFFVTMTLERRGAAHVLRDRGLRIFGTFVLFMVIFSVLFDKGWLELHHLWFLWFLTLYCLAAVLVVWSQLSRLLLPLAWVMGSFPRMALLYLPMLLLVIFAKEDLTNQIIPEWLTEFRPQGLIYYGFFFLLGCGLWQHRDRIEDLKSVRGLTASLGLSIGLTIMLLTAQWAGLAEDWMYVLGIPAAQLGIIFGLVGLAEATVRQSSRVLRFCVESAYAVYLFHVYIVIIVGGGLIVAEVPLHLAISLTIAAGLVLSVLCYVVLVRYTPLDWMLAGPKAARFPKVFRPKKMAAG